MNSTPAHYLTEDRTNLGQRFLTCSCGHTETGSARNRDVQDNMDVHFRQVARDVATARKD